MIRQFGSWSTVFIIRYFIELFKIKLLRFCLFLPLYIFKIFKYLKLYLFLLKKIEFLSEVKSKTFPSKLYNLDCSELKNE